MNTFRALRAPVTSSEAEAVLLDDPTQITVRTALKRDKKALLQLFKNEAEECAAFSMHSLFTKTLQPFGVFITLWAVLVEIARQWIIRRRTEELVDIYSVGLSRDEFHSFLATSAFAGIAAATSALLCFMWISHSKYERWSKIEQHLWQVDNFDEKEQIVEHDGVQVKKLPRHKRDPAVWVALLQGRYVGFVQARTMKRQEDGKEVTDGIIRLALHVHHRNDETGTVLLNVATTHAQRRGWQHIYAIVSKYHTPIIQTLQAHQFEQINVLATHDHIVSLLASYPSYVARDQAVYQLRV
jgi:GNAT superfamily N-acetyltransferase